MPVVVDGVLRRGRLLRRRFRGAFLEELQRVIGERVGEIEILRQVYAHLVQIERVKAFRESREFVDEPEPVLKLGNAKKAETIERVGDIFFFKTKINE